MKLINITNHQLTKEQRNEFDSVVEMPAGLKAEWAQVGHSEAHAERAASLVFDWMGQQDLESARVAVQGHFGATYRLVRKIKSTPAFAVYASSKRESVEETLPDGSVIKKTKFRHLGWNRY